MKRFLLFACTGIFIFVSSCTSYDLKEKDPAGFVIPAYQAREDFKTFRTIIEKAHPSLYTYISKNRFITIFDSVEASIGKKITYRDFYNKLFFLTNELGCSHTMVRLPSPVYDSLLNRELFFPLPVLLINDKLIVNSDHELPHGTEILSINGKPVAALLDSIRFYNAVEGFHRTAQRQMASTEFGFELFMKFGGQKKYRVEVRDTSGVFKAVLLNAIDLDNLYVREAGRYYFDAEDVDYSMIIDEEDKSALIRILTFEFESDTKQKAFEAFLKNSFELLYRRNDIRSIIIDLRENTGGYLYNCFLLNSYLSQTEFDEYKDVYSRIRFVPYEDFLSPRFDQADVNGVNNRLKGEFEKRGRGYFLKKQSIKSWQPAKNRFSGNVYIITNWRVNSAASYFTLLAKKTAAAKTVGVETAGGSHSGNGFKTIVYALHQTKFEFEFPYAKMLYTQGGSFSGSGLIPDYPVPDNIESFMKNKDRQLIFIHDSLMKND